LQKYYGKCAQRRAGSRSLHIIKTEKLTSFDVPSEEKHLGAKSALENACRNVSGAAVVQRLVCSRVFCNFGKGRKCVGKALSKATHNSSVKFFFCENVESEDLHGQRAAAVPPRFLHPAKEQGPVFNYMSWPPGVKLAPRGEVGPPGLSWPPGVKLAPRG
jgi:hypothetical protein